MGHIKFVTAAANIRCRMYNIPISSESLSTDNGVENNCLDPLFVQSVSGNIVPAVLSSTAVTAGLAVLELQKLIMCALNQNIKQADKKSNELFLVGNMKHLIPSFLKKSFAILRGKSYFSPIKQTSNSLGLSFKPTSICQLQNSFINLAIPSIAFVDPVIVPKRKIEFTGEYFSKWDIVEVSEYLLNYYSYCSFYFL